MNRSPASSDGTLWFINDNDYSSHMNVRIFVLYVSMLGEQNGRNVCWEMVDLERDAVKKKMVNRDAHVFTPGYIQNTDIPAGKPLANLPRTAVTSPNMVHMQHDQLAVYFVTDSPSLLPFSLHFSSNLFVAMTTKASLSISYIQSVHLGCYQPAFSLTYVTAVLFPCHPKRF